MQSCASVATIANRNDIAVPGSLPETIPARCSSVDTDTTRSIITRSDTTRSDTTRSDTTRSDTFNAPKRAGTDPYSSRSNTLNAPRRCGTDPQVTRETKRSNTDFHLALNGLFGFSEDQEYQDRRQLRLRSNGPRNTRKSMHSSDSGSDLRSDASTGKEIVYMEGGGCAEEVEAGSQSCTHLSS
ncbi:hypothetical protein P171DRAFT_286586 [Karstenula rhodostoma CBS 690.94]|uniref:Uncharacterized protein n=1 Tax=Karstenula rhodostoma CBS 690.94 TaxID=1392251 RepID=A0A9P4UD96_9PLEO|nr:hypothetical protein P171DRAFT_286586 [Karstenula rhodostoma CBS 690.94]